MSSRYGTKKAKKKPAKKPSRKPAYTKFTVKEKAALKAFLKAIEDNIDSTERIIRARVNFEKAHGKKPSDPCNCGILRKNHTGVRHGFNLDIGTLAGINVKTGSF